MRRLPTYQIRGNFLESLYGKILCWVLLANFHVQHLVSWLVGCSRIPIEKLALSRLGWSLVETTPLSHSTKCARAATPLSHSRDFEERYRYR